MSELKGHPHGINKLLFAPLILGDVGQGTTIKYTLLSNGTDERWDRNIVIAWALDSNGREIAATPFAPFEVDRRTETAMSSIATDLQEEHAVTEEETGSIRTALRTAIEAVEKEHRLKDLPYVSGALPHYNGTDLFSFDGQGMRVLYLIENGTTQHGMRPAEKLPQIVIAMVREPKLSINDNKDGNEDEGNNQRFETIQTLRGHSDMILSVAFSPDGKLVASASWDQTFRIFSVETGECLHSIGPTGNQNWVAKFTPSGDRILFSGGGGGRDKPSPLAVYNTGTGEEVNRLRHPNLKSCLRETAVHPDRRSAVVANGASLLLWDLTDGSSVRQGDEDPLDNAIEILKLAVPDPETNPAEHRVVRPFLSFVDVAWVDGGRKLLARASDHSISVWDREQNVQWRFQRPEGEGLSGFSNEFAYVHEGERGMTISLDGDGKVRFWKL